MPIISWRRWKKLRDNSPVLSVLVAVGMLFSINGWNVVGLFKENSPPAPPIIVVTANDEAVTERLIERVLNKRASKLQVNRAAASRNSESHTQSGSLSVTDHLTKPSYLKSIQPSLATFASNTALGVGVQLGVPGVSDLTRPSYLTGIQSPSAGGIQLASLSVTVFKSPSYLGGVQLPSANLTNNSALGAEVQLGLSGAPNFTAQSYLTNIQLPSASLTGNLALGASVQLAAPSVIYPTGPSYLNGVQLPSTNLFNSGDHVLGGGLYTNPTQNFGVAKPL